MARDIFVSHSQPDRDRAFELTNHLATNGLAVWIAPPPAAERDPPEDRRRFLQPRQ